MNYLLIVLTIICDCSILSHLTNIFCSKCSEKTSQKQVYICLCLYVYAKSRSKLSKFARKCAQRIAVKGNKEYMRRELKKGKLNEKQVY